MGTPKSCCSFHEVSVAVLLPLEFVLWNPLGRSNLNPNIAYISLSWFAEV